MRKSRATESALQRLESPAADAEVALPLSVGGVGGGQPLADGQAGGVLLAGGGGVPAATARSPSLARGLSNAEIGVELVRVRATVKTHVARLLAKLGQRYRVQLVVFAYENGVVTPTCEQFTLWLLPAMLRSP